ncbi:protein HIRA-like [Ostrinia nubilalis]|uniref:protein HIRA-like n=1 Tax=Ostrinia nubilalis TaxID=29057 RepID=UPI003082398B
MVMDDLMKVAKRHWKSLEKVVVWSDATDPVWRASGPLAATRPPSQGSHGSSQPLYREHRTHSHNVAASGAYSAGAARSWLEARAAASLHLRRARDYRHWLTALVAHLASHGTEDQLRTILDDFLGPSHCTSTPKKWQSTILGMNKHEVLEEMLSILVRQLRWQRLYTEYADQLGALAVNGH